MNCQGCNKPIADHDRFYVFEIIDYYPGGGMSDLRMIVNSLDQIPPDGEYLIEGVYTCENKLYYAHTGKEVLPS